MIHCIEDFIPEKQLLMINNLIKDNQILFSYKTLTDLQVSFSIVHDLKDPIFIDMYLDLTQKLINKIKNCFNFEVSNGGLDNIVKYSPGDNLPLHCDHDLRVPQKIKGTDISCVIYYNDDYIGGRIVFPKKNIKIYPKKGSLLIFPSYEDYEHMVEKVQFGNKYITSSFWDIIG
jgi:hypothetical protein